ncbi:hypothetical protein N1028_06385 [Herbiconiux sp. CPCC 203407]|uniref:Uncharacterized protein n=1 Tax=Herbiconiux oxytropis TaxID=2970915 RepID=A0AA41XG06_9MICO|nr:hypothetical protein [Herbiconiux oxytropis]MCS5721936.1 hypothetical protein [Herbiconiux oxytropis]MCS5725519.1 hypothetical protein [Herbiconiux oxytropis]
MTAVQTPTAARTAAGSGSRVIPVVRLHLVNRFSMLVLPWIILGFIFLVNLAIWWIVMSAVGPDADRADVQEGLQWSGASFYIFVYMMVLGVQAIALTFPFALGFSATRRDFWLGTSLTFVLLSALYAAGMTVLALIEVTTDGWWLGGRMFSALYFGGDAMPWYARFFLFFATFLFFFFVGALAAAIYQRWRVNGMLIFFGALTVALVGAAALITFSESWPAVGTWFVETGAPGVVAWSLVPTALAALVGYVILRRTTPKNS